jgi:hypothetical protein
MYETHPHARGAEDDDAFSERKQTGLEIAVGAEGGEA